MTATWKDQILALVENREELDAASLCREFAISSTEDRQALVDCLTVFVEVYDLPMGVLRATDPLAVFIEAPPARNPISWIFNRFAIDDATSELNYRLGRQRMNIGVEDVPTRRPRTVGEYVRMWMGEDLDG